MAQYISNLKHIFSNQRGLKMTQKNKTEKTYLKDYKQPNFWLPQTHLDVTIGDSFTEVVTTVEVESNKSNPSDTLVLDGVNIEVVKIALDGTELSSNQYNITEDTSEGGKVVGKLSIPSVPEKFTLAITGRIKPQENFSNEGLYKAGEAFLTQCEAEGFRRISYFLDRPDVMSEYRVSITGDKSTYPYLLSNGNKVSEKDNGNGTHTIEWHDPSLKPSYLFALVAGKFNVIEDSYTTMSGRNVDLQIFADEDVEDSEMTHAMESLIESMKFDETRFDREYDLDLYMIVATSQFNMGAMENKGLNIFNTTVVLGSSKTATDDRLQRISDVIYHEYAHNWSGNLVTCRDWFQLSIKEGLTVFRDGQFNADHTSHAVKRIEDVKFLRSAQFAEDAGSDAHPIRPHFFTTINNFYTVTVYEKGAEIIYMLYSMLGKEGFKQALNLYFSRHKGQAVTEDEFITAMEDSSGLNLSQFRHWYDQGGTPLVKVTTSYDADSKKFTLNLAQSVRQLDGYPEPKPFHMPIAVGLLDSNGNNMLEKDASDVYCDGTAILNFTEAQQTFTFEGIEEQPVLSFLRNFSAPVKVELTQTDADLLHLMKYDNDPYNKWEACNRLVTKELKRLIAEDEKGNNLVADKALIDILKDVLEDTSLDNDMKRLMLSLPTESTLHGLYDVVPVNNIYAARKAFKQQMATALENNLLTVYKQLENVDSADARGLKNLCLGYLTSIDGLKYIDLANTQYTNAQNFTDECGAFACVVYGEDTSWKKNIVPNFLKKWSNNTDVMNTWFSTQASQDRDDLIPVVQNLMTHKAFDNKNPNKIRSVIGAFMGQHVHFHKEDGSGYAFLADEILRLDGFNPQVASRFMAPFAQAKKYSQQRQQLMKAEVERINNHPGLSKDVAEKAGKVLEMLK